MDRQENWGGSYARGRMMTWQEAKDRYEAWAAKKRKNKASDLVIDCSNTYLDFVERDNAYCIRLYRTCVVKIYEGDIYELNMGGYNTVTTRDRLNAYSPVSVFQTRKGTMVGINAWKPSVLAPEYGRVSVPYFNGIRVNASGELAE